MRTTSLLGSVFLLLVFTSLPATAQLQDRILTYTFGRFSDDCRDELPPLMPPADIFASPVTRGDVRCHAGTAHFSFDWALADTLDVEKYLMFTLQPEIEGTLRFTPEDTLSIVASDNAGVMKLAVQYQTDSTYIPLDIPAGFSDSSNFDTGNPDTLRFGFQDVVIADTMSFRIYGFNASGESQLLLLQSIEVSFKLDVPVSTEQQKPRAFSAVGAYPNPFQNRTTLSFNLAAPASVELVIYDTLGRPVKTLVNDWLNQGKHNVVWTGAGMPAGIYFIRLRTANAVHVRPVTLL
ncbi:MAG: T9SS type A sorting domain-containing protein [Pseudomonadota bacterium]